MNVRTPEQEREAVEVVAYMKRLAGAECRADGRCYDVVFVPVDGYEPLTTVAQHQRIVAQQQVECQECMLKQPEIDLLWSDRRKDADLIHQLRAALAAHANHAEVPKYVPE